MYQYVHKRATFIGPSARRPASQPRVMGEVRLQHVSVDTEGASRPGKTQVLGHEEKEKERQRPGPADDFMSDPVGPRRPPGREEPRERVHSRYETARQDSGRAGRRDSDRAPKNRFDADVDDGHGYAAFWGHVDGLTTRLAVSDLCGPSV
jgi:hypothetical protein